MPDFFNSKDDELVLPSYPQDPDQIANRRKLVDKTEKLLQKNEVEYNIDSDNKRDFINAAPSIIGERNLPIELTLFDNISNLCSYLNKELVSIGGHVKRDNYNNLYLYYDKSLMKESVITEDIKSTVSNIRTKIKNKIDTISSSLRPMTRLEASKKYDVISDENVKEIKSIIKKVSDEAIKIFSKKDIVTKKKHSKVCKYSTNSTVKEEYLCGIKSKDAFHKIECIAVTISMTNRNVSDKEYEEIESIIWDEMYNDITAYIKSLKSKFAIHANPEIHDYNMHGRQKICLCITYFQELKPKSAVKEANIFINTDRVEYNVDTLKPDTKNNILFITGYSGSGKSTLMAELREKYGNNIMTVAGDHFFMVLRYKYRIEHGMPMSKQYDKYNCINDASKAYLGPILTKYFDLYYCSLSISTDSFTNPQLLEYWEGFIHWLYEDTTVNKAFYRGKIIVVEGIQISNTDPELYRNHALIITGTSALTSWARKANRDIFSEKKYDWKHIKTLFTMIPVYLNDTKQLNDLEKVMKEDANYSKYSSDIHAIINNLSKEELDHIGGGYWVDSNRVIYRKVEYSNNKPIAFIDVYLLPKYKNTGLVVIAVSKEARGKGVGSRLTKDAIISLRTDNRIDKLRWKVDYDNDASINMAKSLGFELIDDGVKEKIFQYKLSNNTIKESDVLYMPNTMGDLQTLLDNTDPKHIYFTSDWHLLKNRYKNERNYVNCQEIVTWCRQNIKDDDIFMYLGDISYRWIDEKGEEESMKIMASLPGIKVLIAGNHDRMLGDDYLHGCGFKYIFDEYTWKNLVFTHRPINMSLYPDDYWNIHGHIHKWKKYNTTDGKKNINVYPYWFDNKPVTLDYLLKHKEELVKDNEWNPNDILSETKRSELPDKAFGIPEDRKYPLDTEQHVRSAIKLFGHAEEGKKKKLAQNIRSAAKKYDISIPENTQCYKYLNEGSIESVIPEGVTNVVFDMGSVLVNHNMIKTLHEGLILSHFVVHEIYDFLQETLFVEGGKQIDLCTTEWMKNHIKSVAPEQYVKFIDRIFELVPEAMYKYEYTDELLDALRSKGYKLYYLSNWPRWSYTLEESFFRPILEKFDGGRFSFESKQFMKPDLEFYEDFLNIYNLDPATCIFFDDKQENVKAAEEVGMKAVLFNSEETPKQLLWDNFNIPSDVNNTILVNMGAKLESVNLDKINWWHLSPSLDTNYPDEELYYKNFDTCIQSITNNQLKDGPIERYVFICNGDVGDLTSIPVGRILINPDRSSEWLIQYPLEYKDGLYQTVLNEWSMAACNPICGITKPFILKLTNDCGSLINTKQYALAPDIISDKYLVVNENAQLEIVDFNKFKDCFVEVYEFVGNKSRLNKLSKAYNEGKIVDNTVFYTMLTGKPMLCEDQIDFDPSFRKVDLEYMKEDTIAKLATIKDECLKILNENTYSLLHAPIITETFDVKVIDIPFLSKYNKHGDISIKEDLDGYYFYSSLTGKRSSSVESTSLLTEAMIKSIY